MTETLTMFRHVVYTKDDHEPQHMSRSSFPNSGNDSQHKHIIRLIKQHKQFTPIFEESM